MSSIKKFAVLSMLVVVLIAFNMPASAAIGIGSAGAATAAASSISAVSTTATAAGFGAFGGFGFPFNWGFSRFGIGAFPFNWGMGAGLGPFGLGWNQFTPGFGSMGSFFSPCFMGTGCFQGLPFIMGTIGGCAGPGFGLAPWAFGLGGCAKSMPLFFGAHGFGFPFTFPGFGASLIPPVPVPAAIPAAIPAVAGVCQGLPFIMGSIGGCAGPGFGLAPWAFGLGGCAKSMPLFFGAHGFGFPFTFPGFGASLIPTTLC